MSRMLAALTVSAALLLLPGCFRIFTPVPTVWPEIPMPERPKPYIPDKIPADEDGRKFADAAVMYRQHITVLENTIQRYNSNAAAHNDRVEKALFGK